MLRTGQTRRFARINVTVLLLLAGVSFVGLGGTCGGISPLPPLDPNRQRAAGVQLHRAEP